MSTDEATGGDNVTPAPPAVEQLRVVCAWCKEILHKGAPGAATSHGICQPCSDKLGPVHVTAAGEVEFPA